VTRLPRVSRRLPLWLALRYLRAVRRSQSVSFISLVSVAGLVLGVAVLVLVLSVMNGFDRELRERILGVVPQITITGFVDAHARDALAERLRDRRSIAGVAPFLQAEGMLSHAGRVLPVAVYGVRPEAEKGVSSLARHMRGVSLVSALRPSGQGAVMGAPLASQLGLRAGDPVSLVLPVASGDSVRPRLGALRLTGTFELGADLDYGLIVVHLRVLESLLPPGQAQPGLRLRVDDVLAAPSIAASLRQEWAGRGLTVDDWSTQYGELFRAVGMEKTMMALLLLLIVAIAVFNIVASLVMLVDEKRGAVAILRSLGATARMITGVFVLQGALIGVTGVVAGLALGALLAHNAPGLLAGLESVFGFRMLAGTFFEQLPSELQPGDLWRVGLAAFALAALATLYPAHRAARIAPASALHQG